MSHVMRYTNGEWRCTCGWTTDTRWPDIVAEFDTHKAEAMSDD